MDHMSQTESPRTAAEIDANIAASAARYAAGTVNGLWPEVDDEDDADELYPR